MSDSIITTLAKLGTAKFGPSWLFLKTAEEASEVIHDALKLASTSSVTNNPRTPEELDEFRCNLLNEIAQCQIYMEMLVSQLDAEQQVGINRWAQIQRLTDKFQ